MTTGYARVCVYTILYCESCKYRYTTKYVAAKNKFVNILCFDAFISIKPYDSKSMTKQNVRLKLGL